MIFGGLIGALLMNAYYARGRVMTENMTMDVSCKCPAFLSRIGGDEAKYLVPSANESKLYD